MHTLVTITKQTVRFPILNQLLLSLFNFFFMAKLSRFCGTDLIGFRFLNEIPTRTIRLNSNVTFHMKRTE